MIKIINKAIKIKKICEFLFSTKTIFNLTQEVEIKNIYFYRNYVYMNKTKKKIIKKLLQTF